MTLRIAGLDLGSNTVKITVAEVGRDGALTVLAEDARITRVGQGLDQTGRVAPEAMERTLTALKALVELAHGLGATRIGCVGTAGLRGAANAEEFLARARAECGLNVEIIDGLREAELAFRAPVESYGPGPLLVCDIGGRSTEVVLGSLAGGAPRGLGHAGSADITARVSLELGSVRLTERFLAHDPPEPREREAMREYLASAFEAAPPAPPEAQMVGVSGTVLSIMGLHLDVDEMDEAVRRGEGRRLPLAAAESVLERLAALPTRERIRGTVLPEGRADVIVAGAEILVGLLRHYGRDHMVVSNRGVRYGLLFEMAQ